MTDSPAGAARFTQRAGIVTGASSGIGAATAERLASEGARLCLVAHEDDASALEEQVARCPGSIAVVGDVGDPDVAKTAVRRCLESFGGLQFTVSNVGIAYLENVRDTPITHLDRTLHVNVRGMFLVAQAAAQAMADQGGGAICCTTSVGGWLGEELQATYNLSKAAVSQLARSMAVDLASVGVRVNAVAPGWVKTPATRAVLEDDATWGKFRTRVPMDRPATPSEIAAVIAFLLSDEASYMTGSIVVVDGGMTAGYRWTGWEAASA